MVKRIGNVAALLGTGTSESDGCGLKMQCQLAFFIIILFSFVFLSLYLNFQVIGEELAVHQGRLDRNRLIASQLGRSVVMSPVTADVSAETDVGGDRSDSTMPVSLAASADHVEQQLKVLRQSLDLLAENTERQTSAVSNCNGAITTAERLINTARQTMCTVEEEEDSDVEGERIEDKSVYLRDIVFQFSSTEDGSSLAQSFGPG